VCPCGAVSGQQVVEGRVYISAVQWELLLCVGGLSLPFEFMK